MSSSSYQRILVTSALPYANGPSHLGRLTGAYLPADIYVRYQRLMKRDVLFICGSDEHGVPITLQAEKEKVSPQSLVDRYHTIILDEFTRMGIRFDHYSRTTRPIHHATAREFFLDLYAKGILKKKPEMQWYDEQARMFLSDRYVEGTCPICQFTEARGDQCEKCGSYLNQMQLLRPRSKVTGTTPVARETTHWYMPLGDFQDALESWIATKTHWKDNVLNYCKGWFAQKLGDRAITRDLDWGVALPDTDRNGQPIEGAKGKVLYVWFEAVLGYISSTKEWAESIGQPERWKDYWQDEHTQLVHFIGKDNIVFHALMFPAILMAYNQGRTTGRYTLVSDIPACEFLNLEGAKLSTSRNYAVWVKDYLEHFPPDPLRYTLTSILPESKDSDFSWKDFQARNNNELADILGNFINRTMTFVFRHFGGRVPEAGDFSEADRTMLEEIRKSQEETGRLIETFRFRDACRRFMDLARAGNKYFNDSEPWKTIKTDPKRCAHTIYVSLQTIRALSILMHPFMPFSSDRIWRMLNLPGLPEDASWTDIASGTLPAGHSLNAPEIIFSKIEDEKIRPQVERLQKLLADTPPQAATPEVPLVSIDDFAKLDLRTAEIISAERVPKSKKLLKLQVQLGEEIRPVIAGLAEHYTPEELIGKTVILVANLQPAMIFGMESRGMVLAVEHNNQLSVVLPHKPVPAGCRVK